MDAEEALDIEKSMVTLFKTINVPTVEGLALLALHKRFNTEKIVEALSITKTFMEADIVERGKMMGIKITPSGGENEPFL